MEPTLVLGRAVRLGAALAAVATTLSLAVPAASAERGRRGPAGVALPGFAVERVREGTSQIFTLDGNGDNPFQLTHGTESASSPAWSPDGAFVAYAVTGSYGASNIEVIGSGGSGGFGVASLPGQGSTVHVDGISWSPDGERLAFATDYQGAWRIWTVEVDGSRLRQLTTGPGADHRPSWSPDGSRIVFARARFGRSALFVADAETGWVDRLTDGPVDRAPAWSPDGGTIAFSADRGSGRHIYAVRTDGSALVAITAGAGRDESPAWSPWNDQIVFRRSGDGVSRHSRLVAVEIVGGAQRDLTDGSPADRSPAWSPPDASTRLLDGAAKDGLRHALAAADEYRQQEGTYAGLSIVQLAQLDPSDIYIVPNMVSIPPTISAGSNGDLFYAARASMTGFCFFVVAQGGGPVLYGAAAAEPPCSADATEPYADGSQWPAG